MNIEYVKEKIEYIKSIAGDDESAHSEEDSLMVELLSAIAADECDDPAACASEALKSQEIEFARWCA